MTKKTSHGELLFDYDWIKSQGSGSWCYEITDEQVMVILSVANRMKWLARWYSPLKVVMDTDWIEAIVDNLQAEFLSGGCMPNLEFQIGDGTGGLSDGNLYWRINGGDWIDIGHVVGADGADGAAGVPGTCDCAPGGVVDSGTQSSIKKCDKATLLAYRIATNAGNLIGSRASNPSYTAEQLTDLIMSTYGEGTFTWAGCYNAVNYLIDSIENLGDLDLSTPGITALKSSLYCCGMSSLGELSSGDPASIAEGIDGDGYLNNVYEASYLKLVFRAFDPAYIATQIFQNVIVNPYGGDCTSDFCGDYDWEQTFDFTSDDFDQFVKPYPSYDDTIITSEYVAATGWQHYDREASAGNWTRYNIFDIKPPSGTFDIVYMKMDMNIDAPSGHYIDYQLASYGSYPYTAGSETNLIEEAKPIEAVPDYIIWDGERTVAALRCAIYVDGGKATQGELVGSGLITKVIIRGTGSNPFE